MLVRPRLSPHKRTSVKVVNDTLYLEVSDLESAGVSVLTIKTARRDDRSGWIFIKDPSDARKVLVRYDTLKDRYRQQADEHFGGCQNYFTNQQLLAHLVAKPEDIEFINEFRINNGDRLPEKARKEYTTTCQWLNLLSQVTAANVQKFGFSNMKDFNTAAAAIIKAQGVKLPAAYTKLRERVREYQAAGAASVVSKKWGNNNSSKLGEDQLALLRQLYAQGNQLGYPQVATLYNKVALERGWPTVTAQAVMVQLKKPGIQQQVVGLREGVASFREFGDFVVSRKRPSRPGMLWVGDGTPYELYYQTTVTDKNGHAVTKHWNRKVVYVVIDAFNDAWMGYAIGDTESADLAKLAWRNACVNMGILPDQVKTDRFAQSVLKPFYEKIALNSDFYSPSSVGNARDKVIEPWFGRHFDQVTRLYANFAGHGIRAKQQSNPDFLNEMKKHFPSEAGVVKQIQDAMDVWNNTPVAKYDGKSRIEHWRQAHTTARAISDESRLSIFGHTHTRTNKLTNKGITVTLLGEPRTYMLFDHQFADTIGLTYMVTYDPCDLSKILVVADGGRKKFVVPQFEALPMAFGDAGEGDRTRLNTVLRYKRERIEHIAGKNNNDRELVEAMGLSKGLFITGGQQKDMLVPAENTLKELPEPSETISLGNSAGFTFTKRDMYDDD